MRTKTKSIKNSLISGWIVSSWILALVKTSIWKQTLKCKKNQSSSVSFLQWCLKSINTHQVLKHKLTSLRLELLMDQRKLNQWAKKFWMRTLEITFSSIHYLFKLSQTLTWKVIFKWKAKWWKFIKSWLSWAKLSSNLSHLSLMDQMKRSVPKLLKKL